MILWLLIIGAIIWTIILTVKTYQVSHSIGGALLIFMFCLFATPLLAHLIYEVSI
jgi:hypothetical protein